MTTETNSTLVLISKLLAKAQDKSVTEAEAALFAEKVQELLQDNGLTMAQVEAAGGSTDTSQRGKHATGRRAMYNYQRQLMGALAELHFCIHQVVEEADEHGRKSKRHVLVGRRVNVDGTSMLYDYLVTTMRRLVQEAGHAYGKTGERDLHYWLEGCATRLCERLHQKRRQRERESAEAEAARQAAMNGNGTHKELVLSDVYGTEADLNNDALNNFAPGTTATRRRKSEEMAMQQRAKHDALVAEGMDSTEAWYHAYGYGAEQVARYVAMDKEDAKRQARNRRRRGGRGRTSNFTMGDRRHHEKVNSAAYQAGRAAGDDIGLDSQVGNSKRKSLPRS